VRRAVCGVTAWRNNAVGLNSIIDRRQYFSSADGLRDALAVESCQLMPHNCIKIASYE